jgi:hypothetical protein
VQFPLQLEQQLPHHLLVLRHLQLLQQQEVQLVVLTLQGQAVPVELGHLEV